MSPNRIAAVVVKEFRHLLRDKRTLLTILLMPVMELLLFAYAISFDVRNVPTVVVDQDRTPASRSYIQSYSAGGFFSVRGEAPAVGAIDEVFAQKEARVVVVVAPGFERQLQSGQRAEVAVLVDGSEPNAARLGEAYALALNHIYNQQVTVTWAERQGFDVGAIGGVEPRVRTWYNADRRSSTFLIPGLIVVIIMLVTVQQTAVTVVRERDLHTQEQLIVSPLTHTELVIGKLLPGTVVAFVAMALVMVIGLWLFEVPLRGNLGALALGAGVFVFSCLALGLMVSAITPSPETANMVALLISSLPAFLLSGFVFPLSSLHRVLQWASNLFPVGHMVTLSRGVFLKGWGFSEARTELGLLVLYATVMLTVAVYLYGRSVRR